MLNQCNVSIRLFGFFILIIVGVLGWFTSPVHLKFGGDILKDLPTMFGYLVLISLFVERAIEVFLSAWRSQGADRMDWKIGSIEESIVDQQESPDPDNELIKKLKKNLETFEKKRTIYRATSRFIAQWLGLGIGVLISLVGVRVLGNIVDISSLPKNQAQAGAFIIVDIMLTGAVLAGGSEAINKIMKIYNGFMTSTAEKARNP